MTPEQKSFALALVLKPFAALAFMTLLLAIRFAVMKYMRDGWLKRLFLVRLNKPRR